MPKIKRTVKEKTGFPLFDDNDNVPELNTSDLENELKDLLGGEGVGSDSDPSEEVNEDDPKLLAELEAFVSDDGHKRAKSDSTAHEEPSGVSAAEIQERISAYKSSIQILKSTQPSNTSHLRRLERTLQQLDSLASQVAKGQVIQPDELPPPPPPIPPSVTLREPQNPPTVC
ncbi:hypothetical protein P879_11199 [Paragonimus westermani]|uniref:DM14 domain-containing protein n=1 Tax=Paragonimus westermani TaxID=34504 RepID=A0A8T0D3B3_9TREM|nr:hypothetical protein P879_11199 [Paragonimus westermani]